MICKKCKRQYEGESCPYCGTPASDEKEDQKEKNAMAKPSPTQFPPSEPTSPRKPSGPNKRRWWILFLLLGVVLAAVMVGMTWNSQDKSSSATYCPYGDTHDIHLDTIKADCTQRGYTSGTCQKCGYTYMQDMVNALGHQWEEPVSVEPQSCTEDGLLRKSCSRCGATKNEPLFHSGHSYQLSATEKDEESETVEFVCTVCGDSIIQNWNESQPREWKEKAYLPDRSKDFTFLVCCGQGEAYLRENLILTGNSGSIPYNVTSEEDGIYRIAAAEPYQQYQTYTAQLSEDMGFPEYGAKALEFSIIGSDRADVEFNEDNLIFLKALELQQYGTSGKYALEWDEAAQRYYLTLFQLENLDTSMIGKVLGIGDYVSTGEILKDGTRELCFAKLEKISHNEEGETLLELSVPQLSEVYDKLDIYFAGGVSGIQLNGNPEAAFMNSVLYSEDFAEYLTAVHLAADSYAQDHGLVVTPLSEITKDNLQFKLTKHSLEKVDNTNTAMLDLGGEINYTIPLKNKDGKACGAIVMTCNAGITASISAGGSFKDDESVNLYLTNTTTTTLGFEMKFDLAYSQAYEETYLLHKNTQKIHTSTCRIANKETSSANLQKLTAQELSELYHGDREAMKQHECKVCMAVTGLDGTAYAYNRNTDVLHCMNCRHVTDINECNLYTLYPDNTLHFTPCNDCRPQDREVQDFDKRMLNAIQGSDWSEQVSAFQEMMGSSIGNQKPSMETDPNLTVPINVAGVFNIKIGVTPVFEFDMEASADFSITANTKNEYGIRSVGKGFETYHNEYPGEIDYDLRFTGEADAKFGIMVSAMAYPAGCENVAHIAINGQVGLYGHFAGIFYAEGTLEKDNDAYCAARLEAGLYAGMGGYWKILWFDSPFEIINEQRLPLFKWGYDRMYYAFEEEYIELTADDSFVYLNLVTLMQAKYLDLTTMEYHSNTVSPISKSRLNVTVEITNEDGSPCDYLEYISENGTIHKKDNAPEDFTAVITVSVAPKVLIDSIEDFLASETEELVYGYSMDPLVIKVKTEEKKLLTRVNEYWGDRLQYSSSLVYNDKHQLSNVVYAYGYGRGSAVINLPFSYDEEGRLLEANPNMFFHDEYTYNSSGQMITHSHRDDGVNIRYEYEYDEKGNLICENQVYPNDDTVRKICSYAYIYDANGRIIEKHQYTDWSDYAFDVSTKYGSYPYSECVNVTRYSYDSEGRVLTEFSVDIPKTVCNPQGNPNLEWRYQAYYNYDYAPLVLEKSNRGTSVQIWDSEGKRAWEQHLDDKSLDIDDQGYITGSTDIENDTRYELIYGTPVSIEEALNQVYKEQYIAVLQSHPSKKNSVETQYTLYDINKDGIQELIVRENADNYYIYTFFEGYLAQAAKLFLWYPDCLYAYDGNGIVIYDGGQGSLHLEYIFLYTLSELDLEETETLASTEQSSASELYAQLKAFTPIDDFYPISNYAPLENIMQR